MSPKGPKGTVYTEDGTIHSEDEVDILYYWDYGLINGKYDNHMRDEDNDPSDDEDSFLMDCDSDLETDIPEPIYNPMPIPTVRNDIENDIDSSVNDCCCDYGH